MPSLLSSLFVRNQRNVVIETSSRKHVETVETPYLEMDLLVLPPSDASLEEVRLGNVRVKICFDESKMEFPDLPRGELHRWVVDLLKKNL